MNDWVLQQSGREGVLGDSLPIWLENRPPWIDAIAGPDTVWIFANATVTFHFDIVVADEQTPLDLDRLDLRMTRLNNAGTGDTLLFARSYYDLRDTLGLDTMSGDGVFAAGFSANRNSVRDTPYKFAWSPYDRVGQRGETLYTLLMIQFVGNGAPPRTPGRAVKGGFKPIP